MLMPLPFSAINILGHKVSEGGTTKDLSFYAQSRAVTN